MNEGEEIRFIDLFSGIGGFRLGLERANENRMEKYIVQTDISTRNNSLIKAIGSSKEERARYFHCGLERANRGVDSKLTTGKGRHQSKEGHRADSRSKNGNRRKEHTDGTYRCVWSCDWNKYANQVYAKHFGEANHHPSDVRGVNPRDIPDFDLLCSGFPCQAFSVAGKRKGFKDTRGTLFFEICRIAEAKRPPLLLLENVRGLLSHDKGLTFQVILESLEELGYWVEWQVLNSKHFGVPQNRRRVFIIGHLRGTGGREIFPIAEDGGLSEPPRGETLPTLTGTDYKGPSKQRATALVLDTFNRGAKEEEADALKINPSPTSSAVVAISFTNPHDSEEERKINLSDTSRAVKPPYGNQQPLTLDTDKFRIRRLTPVECERLQGFPDGWTEGISDTQRYKCLGNAVTTNVIEFLGRRIKECIKPTPSWVVQLTQIMEAEK